MLRVADHLGVDINDSEVKEAAMLEMRKSSAKLFGALCPSKSGPMNKHIVKHIVKPIL
jgi:hypothetical protein